MTRRNCQTPAKVGSSDADTDQTLIAVTSFCSLDSLSKDNARDSDTGVTVNKDGVRSNGDVKKLVDVTGGGNENVKRLRDVDGGWAWVVLVTSCVSLAVQEVTYSAVGMFQVEFQMTFGGSRGFLALIGSIFVTCTGMLGPLAGALSTQLTPRVTVMMGGAFISLGLVSGSFVSSPTSLLLTYGILGGLGNALIYTPAATAFSGYFVRLRQVANGFVMGSAGVGSLLGPYLARWFIDTHGWRYSLAASGFLTAQVCVLGALIFPRSGSPGLQFFRQTCTRHRPKQKKGEGLEDGEMGEKEEVTTAFLGGKSGAEETVFGEEKLTNGSRASFRSRVWKVVVRKEVWILCVNEMLLMTGYNIELLHQPSYIHTMGVDRRHFPNLFLAFGSSMMFIRVVGGFVFTRFDSHLLPAMFVSEMLMALALALLPLYGVTLPALFVFNVLTGLSYGVGFLLAVPALIKYIGVELLPLAYGLMLLCCGSGSVLAVSSAGLLYDLLGTYKASFYLAGCLTGTGALALLLLLCVRRQQTGREDVGQCGGKLLLQETRGSLKLKM